MFGSHYTLNPVTKSETVYAIGPDEDLIWYSMLKYEVSLEPEPTATLDGVGLNPLTPQK
jgi:hypothetical protein